MKKILLTTATAVALSTSSAYAAQDTFYVKAQTGWSKMAKSKTELGKKNDTKKFKLKSKNTMSFGVGAGYHVMDNVRVDLTFDHFVSPTHKGYKKFEESNLNRNIKIKGEVNTLLLNGFVDVFDADMAKIFVGAGIGVSQVKAKGTETCFAITGDHKPKSYNFKAKQKYNLALAAYVGASYEFTQGVTGELTYSYKDMGKTKKFKYTEKRLEKHEGKAISYKGHNIGAGIRFDI